MAELKAGIIGCGFIANNKHLPSMKRVGGVKVVAFCDLIIEKAKASAKIYGAEDAFTCTDYHDVLEREDIDIIHVCTPNSSHAEITIAALQSGKHVMCEKPMAKTASGAKAMLDAARTSGKLLTLGYQNRFREDSQLMKSLCEKGDLGEIYFGKAFATRRRGVPTWGVFLDKEKQGGGPLIDLATHSLDLTLWMMDNYEPETVIGATFDKIGKMGSNANILGPWDPKKYDVEDSAFGMVRFKNGAAVMIESSWALNMILSSVCHTLLCGTKAGADMFPPNGPVVCTCDLQANPSYHVRVNGERNGKLYIQNYSMGAMFLDDGSGQELMPGGIKEMETWIKAVRGEGELLVKPEQAYVVSCILEGIYKSALSGDVFHFE